MSKRCDLSGRQFGKLKVTEKAEGTESRYALWNCRCDCGAEIKVNTRKLLRGTVRDCGCVPTKNAKNGNKAEDLSGRRFGYLTALYRVENRNGRTCWMCRCECGNLKAVNAHELKSGKTKSCGCRQYSSSLHMADLTGRRFGRLVALYPTDRRDKKLSVYWRCRCDCGKELDVTQNALAYSVCKSCGCLREEYQKKLPDRLHHIDGTCVEWLENRKHRRDNTSGFRGVSRNASGNYRVFIGFKGKQYYLGTYFNFQDAVQARLDAEKIFHEGFVSAYRLWQEKSEQDKDWARENPFIYDVERSGGSFRVSTNVNMGMPYNRDNQENP